MARTTPKMLKHASNCNLKNFLSRPTPNSQNIVTDAYANIRTHVLPSVPDSPMSQCARRLYSLPTRESELFTQLHVLHCAKVETTQMRNNENRYTFPNIMHDLCYYVEVEPTLQLLQVDSFAKQKMALTKTRE